MNKKGNSNTLVIVLCLIIIFGISALLGSSQIAGNVVHNLGCKQVTEYRTEYITEEYHSSATRCDVLNECVCIHKSWGGLGACDSCRCTRRVPEQVPYTVEKCVWD